MIYLFKEDYLKLFLEQLTLPSDRKRKDMVEKTEGRRNRKLSMHESTKERQRRGGSTSSLSYAL